MKLSIHFYDDPAYRTDRREVPAAWDEAQAKWWFSVVDVVGILNDEPDYTKVRN